MSIASPTLIPALPHVDEGHCVFLLGTDIHIHEGTPEQEQRVAVTPAQMKQLREWLESAGVSCDFLVVAGAGSAAGFSDPEYQKSGARCVAESELPKLDPAPDVVHALKEPCVYENTIPGPFLRIGALHTGEELDPDSGTARLLVGRHACVVFDGSAIGGYAYRHSTPPGFPIPIRSSMSVFAGKLAAGDVVKHLGGKSGAHVVIAGGGAAGVAAATRFLREPTVTRVTLMEARPARADELRRQYADEARVTVVEGEWVTGEMLDAADGLVLATFKHGEPAPRVVKTSTIARMSRGAMIVDIAVDEGGSIEEDHGGTIEELRARFEYQAETNMPRRAPLAASEEHGRTVLPYLATLLYLAATRGGARGVMDYLVGVKRSRSQPPAPESVTDPLAALVEDLWAGAAFWGIDEIHVNREIVKKPRQYEALLRERGAAPPV
jgi:alanine dehydrogenase